MASKVFLDANFLLDLTLHRSDFENAAFIMRAGIDGEIELVTTPAVLHITSYFLTKAFNLKQAKQIISTLLNNIQVIDCNHTTALMAINSNIDDIEDALQYFAAISHGVDHFISSDKRLKKSALPQLPVLTASEIIDIIKLHG
jgi:predicted nucleic acid-binding protein